MKKPLGVWIWIVGVSMAIAWINERTPIQGIGPYIGSMRQVGTIFCMGWFLSRMVSHFEQMIVIPKDNKQRIDTTTASALGKLLRIAVWITAAIVILQTLGFSISGVIALGGVGTAVIGFAG